MKKGQKIKVNDSCEVSIFVGCIGEIRKNLGNGKYKVLISNKFDQIAILKENEIDKYE